MSKYPKIHQTQLFINNEFVNSLSGKTFPVMNPSTGEVIANIQEADKEDIDLAAKAARNAFQFGSSWRTMDASKRGELLYQLSDVIERDKDYIAALEMLDNGKNKQWAQWDVDFSIKQLRYCAGWADKIHGKTIPADGDYFCYTRIEPIGVCASVIPWNAPWLFVVKSIASALAAGNVVIVKPAEQTPLSALYLGQLVKEVGFPPGVVNIVPGFGITAGSALSLHMDIDKISFTGSTEVGKIIKQNAGKSNLKKVSLELGGKSPLVVFDDVNLDEVVPMAVFSCYFNQGQCCCAGTRTFVQESIHDEFIKRAKEFVKTIVIGDPLENENTFHGPQIELKHQNRILEMIESGKKEGAKLEIGGEKHGNKGYFVKPTIFSGVKDEMRIAKEEIFGPVMQILTFKTLDEVIQRSNATNYGLAAGIFTQNIHTINTYVQNVQAGVVWVNCYLAGGTQAPFGGYKMSGNGRENGEDGIYEFCEIKSVTVKVPQKNS